MFNEHNARRQEVAYRLIALYWCYYRPFEIEDALSKIGQIERMIHRLYNENDTIGGNAVNIADALYNDGRHPCFEPSIARRCLVFHATL